MLTRRVASFLPPSVRELAKEQLKAVGYVRAEYMGPVDLRGRIDDPLMALECANQCPVLIDVPLERCRGFSLMAFPCSQTSTHPFILTLSDYSSGRVTRYRDSALRKYYRDFQPTSGAEILDLPSELIDKRLFKPALWFIEPWLGVPSNKEEKRKRRIMRNENNLYRLPSESGSEWSQFGPVSDERGELEFNRLIDLFERVTASGYVRRNGPDGDICGELLVSQGECVVEIVRGQHRICALAASGHTHASIRIDTNIQNVFRREDAGQWPAVRSGALTKAQAQHVFDRVFAGRQPYAYQQPRQAIVEHQGMLT